ncbi:MAG TPA: hypothetical protein PK880_05420 [Candidatus Competibacter sp.]|nr:hypothetical protein [Candidatus Competibacter sp.]
MTFKRRWITLIAAGSQKTMDQAPLPQQGSAFSTLQEKSMNVAELIYQHSLQLPESAAQEALVFIQDLATRYAITTVASPLRGANDTEAFLADIADDLSADFPDEITDADLGIDIRREALD